MLTFLWAVGHGSAAHSEPLGGFFSTIARLTTLQHLTIGGWKPYGFRSDPDAAKNPGFPDSTEAAHRSASELDAWQSRHIAAAASSSSGA